MSDTIWLATARRSLGVTEIHGPHHNPAILKLLDDADGHINDGKRLQGISDDEVPWCASAMCAWLEESGIVSPRSAWARSFATWGVGLGGPAVGAIAVLERGPTSGHVTLVVGRDGHGNFVGLGANQSDSVKYSPFAVSRVIAWRWPAGVALPSKIGLPALPLVGADGKLSSNEA
jgi:uncharacterized protein (TIGR02594 family)